MAAAAAVALLLAGGPARSQDAPGGAAPSTKAEADAGSAGDEGGARARGATDDKAGDEGAAAKPGGQAEGKGAGEADAKGAGEADAKADKADGGPTVVDEEEGSVLDDQTFEGEDDDFTPSEEVPVDQPIPYPTDI